MREEATAGGPSSTGGLCLGVMEAGGSCEVGGGASLEAPTDAEPDLHPGGGQP
jgi:hypothetical protein